MARGRMISKSLSTSEKRAALHQHAGKLAEFCQSLYPLLIAHADDWGCQAGDPFTVKHLVDPTSPRRVTDFEAALMALHNVGLITWYQDGERWVVHIRCWFDHQQLKGHDKDGRKRTFSEPPENPKLFEKVAQICPKSPKTALRELNLTELNLTLRSRNTGADAPAEAIDPDLDPGLVTNQDVALFLKRFCELFSQHRHGAKYLVMKSKDVPNVRRLLRVYDQVRLEKLAVVLLTTDDEWVSDTDRGIGILSVKASWLDGLLADYEAKRGPIQVAS